MTQQAQMVDEAIKLVSEYMGQPLYHSGDDQILRPQAVKALNLTSRHITAQTEVIERLVGALEAICENSERPGARLNISSNKWDGYREVPELLLENSLVALAFAREHGAR
jgi:hypothetical protein